MAPEDEMAGQHHQCNGHELGQTLGDGDGQGGLVYCSPWVCKELNTSGQLNNNHNVFFGEISRSSVHFLVGLFAFLILSCISCLYILEINPLSVVSFALFSHILRVVFSSCLWFPLLCKSFYVYLEIKLPKETKDLHTEN